VLLCALRRIGLQHTPFAKATCGTIRLKLLKIGALVRVSVRRIKVAMASACQLAYHWAVAAKPHHVLAAARTDRRPQPRPELRAPGSTSARNRQVSW
jgi:Transposase DDE domain group 1